MVLTSTISHAMQYNYELRFLLMENLMQWREKIYFKYLSVNKTRLSVGDDGRGHM